MSHAPNPGTAVDQYAAIYDGFAHSPTLRRIWATTYLDDSPEDAEPFGFVTLTDLRRMAAELAIGPQDAFADLGCGRGGPGLWIARQTGASVIGIDASPAAIRHATARASALGLQDRARFQRSEFAHTRLSEGTLAGAVSTDALLFAPDLPAACREIARIIRAGGAFVCTSFELFKGSAHFQLAPIPDYRPMLEAAGFTVEHYEETPDWERRMRLLFATIVAEEAHLINEVGHVAAASLQRLATNRPKELADARRVLIVARRQ